MNRDQGAKFFPLLEACKSKAEALNIDYTLPICIEGERNVFEKPVSSEITLVDMLSVHDDERQVNPEETSAARVFAHLRSKQEGL